MWNSIVSKVNAHVATDKRIIISYIFLASLFTCYLGLAISYGALSGQAETQFTCATTEAEKNKITNAEAAILAYKAIFAFYSVIIVATFLLQTVAVLRLIDSVQEDDQFSKTFYKFCAASCFCIIGLLIQAAISIYTAVTSMRNTTKLALIIASELVPTYFLAYLYQYKSPWTVFKKWTASQSASTPRSSKKSSGDKKTDSNTK